MNTCQCRSRGEITTLLTIASFVVISIGLIVGVKTSSTVKKFVPRAQQNCLYAASAEVTYYHKYNLMRTTQNGITPWGVSNDKESQTEPAGKFDDSAIFTYIDYNYPFKQYRDGDRASVKLIGLNTKKYRVVDYFCDPFDTDSKGCDYGVTRSEDGLTLNNFHVTCNVNIRYGWIVEDIPTPTDIPVTTIPLPTLIPTATPTPTATLTPTNTPTPTSRPPTATPYTTNYFIKGTVTIAESIYPATNLIKIQACKMVDGKPDCSSGNPAMIPSTNGQHNFTFDNLEDTAYQLQIVPVFFEGLAHVIGKFPQRTMVKFEQNRRTGCDYSANPESYNTSFCNRTPDKTKDEPRISTATVTFPPNPSTTPQGKGNIKGYFFSSGLTQGFPIVEEKNYYFRLDLCNHNAIDNKPDCSNPRISYLPINVKDICQGFCTYKSPFSIRDIPAGRYVIKLDPYLYKSKNAMSRIILPLNDDEYFLSGMACDNCVAFLNKREFVIDIFSKQSTGYIIPKLNISLARYKPISFNTTLSADNQINDGSLVIEECDGIVDPTNNSINCAYFRRSGRFERHLIPIKGGKGLFEWSRNITNGDSESNLFQRVRIVGFAPLAADSTNTNIPTAATLGTFINCPKIIDQFTCDIPLENNKPISFGYSFSYLVTSIGGRLKVDKLKEQEIDHIDLSICPNGDSSQCQPMGEIAYNKLEKTQEANTHLEYSLELNAYFDNVRRQKSLIGINTPFDFSALVWVKRVKTPFRSEVKKSVTSQSGPFDLVVDTRTPAPTTAIEEKPKRNILFIIHNPFVSSLNERLFDHFYPKKDPVKLAREVVDTINRPNNPIIYQIIDKNIVDKDIVPPVVGEIQDTDYQDLLVSCAKYTTADNPDCIKLKSYVLNYNALFEDYNVCPRINTEEIDEVWQIMQPYTGAGEDDMVGPDPYFINGFVRKNTDCKRNVPVLNLDITREVTEGVHSFGHRIESTMTHIYGQKGEWVWHYPPTNNFEKFIASKGQFYQDWGGGSLSERDVVGCGNIHNPPNSKKGDPSDMALVDSWCPAFLRYPYLGDATVQLSCDNISAGWNCTPPLAMLKYYKWWLEHLPSVDGIDAQGKLNNWWTYINNPEITNRDSNTKAAKDADVNGDKIVNSLDIVLLQKMIASRKYKNEFDIDNNQQINAVELSKAIKLLGYKTELGLKPHNHLK